MTAYYRICLCGTKIPCASNMERQICPNCGMPVDRKWMRHPMETLSQDAADELLEPVPAQRQSVVEDETQTSKEKPEEPQALPAEHPQAEKRPLRRRAKGPEEHTDAQVSVLAPAPQSAVCLDYFGERIEIPVGDEVWIGRAGIGQDFFEGNLLISREHVQVRADRVGRLFVEDSKSLNGTWVTKDRVKRKLKIGETEILGKGDVLWLYNIPLKIGEQNG